MFKMRMLFSSCVFPTHLSVTYNCLLLAISLMVVFISKGFHRLKGNVSGQEVASKQLVFSYSTTLFLWFLA